MENEEKTANEVEEKVDKEIEKKVTNEVEKKVDNTRSEQSEAGIDPKQVLPKMREIIILTDGNSIQLKKADVAGNLELSAVLSTILNNINKR